MINGYKLGCIIFGALIPIFIVMAIFIHGAWGFGGVACAIMIFMLAIFDSIENDNYCL